MSGPFIGTVALANGQVNKYRLGNHHQRLLPGIYLPDDEIVSPAHRARAAWHWTRERGVIAGHSAAVLHGAKWISPELPAEVIYGNRHRQPGVIVHSARLRDDETITIDGMLVTGPARTAVDLGCWYRAEDAVPLIDSLFRATRVAVADALLICQRYPRRRNIAQARRSLALADGGAQSPRESWLRLLLRRHGFPPVQTQIPVYDDGYAFAYIDMGWEQWLVGIEYDGRVHRTRSQFSYDHRRDERLKRMGWTIIRVTADDNEEAIIRQVTEALAHRRR